MRVSPREYRKELLALQRDIRRELAMDHGGVSTAQVLLRRALDLLDELEEPLTRYVMKVGMR